MKIIILGAGQVGVSMAENLSREANDITLVDISAERLAGLQDRLDIRTIEGSGSHPSVLAQAGCEDADLILAVTTFDEVNMIACQIAYTLFRTPKKIARIRNPDFLSHENIFDAKNIPVDVIISPEEILTNQILGLIEHPGALQVLDFAGGKIQLVGIRAYPDGPMVGHQIRELRDHMPDVDSRVAAIYRKDRPILPEANTVVEPYDEVFIVAARDNIRTVISELRRIDTPGRRIMLAGGGNIGFRLARALEEKDYNVKLIERDPERARVIAENLDDTVVLQSDAADEALMLQENIENTEVFCSLTNADEANILSAMLAKRLGAKRVMALINRAAYVELTQSSILDIAISPRMSTVGALLKHIRRGDVVAVHSLRRGAAEAIEAIAHGDASSSQVVGKRIADLKLPTGTTVGAILRGEQVLIGHGDTVIKSEDHVILFVIDKRHIQKVERLFQVGITFI